MLGFELDMGDRLMKRSLFLQAAHMWSTREAYEQRQKLQLRFYEKKHTQGFWKDKKGKSEGEKEGRYSQERK